MAASFAPPRSISVAARFVPVARELDRPSLGVDVAARIRQPVGEREPGIAERLGQRVAHARAAEALHERADRAGAREA